MTKVLNSFCSVVQITSAYNHICIYLNRLVAEVDITWLRKNNFKNNKKFTFQHGKNFFSPSNFIFSLNHNMTPKFCFNWKVCKHRLIWPTLEANTASWDSPTMDPLVIRLKVLSRLAFISNELYSQFNKKSFEVVKIDNGPLK